MQIFILHVYLNTPDEVRQAPGHVEAGTSGTPNHPNLNATTVSNIYISIVEEVHSTE